MSASFPSSAKSFTTKLAGDTIQASHINDIQDEVTAIETALVGGTLPAANASALTALNASALASGTVPDARLSSTVANVDAVETVSAVWTFSAKPNINAALQFPATQAASSDANALDDYEEGTWTPADGSGASLSLTVTAAQYVKIGQLVIASAHIVYPATANGSNTIISGLPFTNQTTTCFGASVNYSDLGSAFYALVLSASATMSFYNLSGANLTNANLSGKQVRFTAVYRASA